MEMFVLSLETALPTLRVLTGDIRRRATRLGLKAGDLHKVLGN